MLLFVTFLVCWKRPLLPARDFHARAPPPVEYEGAGLPEFGTLNGTVTELDTLSSTINLNRTDAALNCSSGFMSIELTFRQKFYGTVYADYDRNSACKVSGNGE